VGLRLHTARALLWHEPIASKPQGQRQDEAADEAGGGRYRERENDGMIPSMRARCVLQDRCIWPHQRGMHQGLPTELRAAGLEGGRRTTALVVHSARSSEGWCGYVQGLPSAFLAAMPTMPTACSTVG
jgi:hypothetical protein